MNDNGWFIKLIGRADRQLTKEHALSAIEVTKIINKAIDQKKLPKKFYFYREVFGRVISLPTDNNKFYEWGLVLRESMPYPKNNKIKYLIPAFSLFSKDINNPSDPTILTQLINKQKKPILDFDLSTLFHTTSILF